MALKGSTHDDRREASAAAKKALLEKFKSRPAPDDPAVLARQAELRAIAEAREARLAEKRVAKEAELRRLAEEERLRQLEEEERQRQAAIQARLEAARLAQLKADQKAARDARYAKRKAKK
jgi:hypothetical protein